MSAPILLPTQAQSETFAGVTYHIDGELVPVLTIDIGHVRSRDVDVNRARLDVRHRDREAHFAREPLEQAGEDFRRIVRRDLFPRIEKSELDEMVIEQCVAIGEAHDAFTFDHAPHFETMRL